MSGTHGGVVARRLVCAKSTLEHFETDLKIVLSVINSYSYLHHHHHHIPLFHTFCSLSTPRLPICMYITVVIYGRTLVLNFMLLMCPNARKEVGTNKRFLVRSSVFRPEVATQNRFLIFLSWCPVTLVRSSMVDVPP